MNMAVLVALLPHNKCGLCAPFGRRTVKPLRGSPARSHRRYRAPIFRGKL